MTLPADTARSKRILSLDGGGVRGIVELAFLARIETLLKAHSSNPEKFRLCDYFDLIGGTSTGSIIAAALATGRSVSEVRTLYEALAAKVFQRKWWRISGLQSRFAAEPLAETLRRELDGITLEDPRIRTLLALVTKRVDTGSPWILSNIPSQPYWNDPDDKTHIGNRHFSLPSLVRASTAAPYYFRPELIPIVEGSEEGVFVDGGLTPYNDPAIPLLMLATMKPFGLCWTLSRDQLLLVSVGTGAFRTKVDKHRLRRKPAGKFALDTLMGLVGECQVATQTILQWVSYSPMPWTINTEIGDLHDDHIAGAPLLTYQRYDIRLETAWLKEKLNFDASDRRVLSLRKMDDPAVMPILFQLATEAADQQVQAEHFSLPFEKTAANSKA
jgi:hypothetical protein